MSISRNCIRIRRIASLEGKKKGSRSQPKIDIREREKKFSFSFTQTSHVIHAATFVKLRIHCSRPFVTEYIEENCLIMTVAIFPLLKRPLFIFLNFSILYWLWKDYYFEITQYDYFSVRISYRKTKKLFNNSWINNIQIANTKPIFNCLLKKSLLHSHLESTTWIEIIRFNFQFIEGLFKSTSKEKMR